MPLFLTPRSNSGVLGESLPFRLDRGEAVVGRGADAQLVLSNPMVSRRHCVVSGEGDVWQVIDTSTGGTLVNGRRIAGPQALRHGDVLTIGDVELEVGIESQAAEPASPGQRLNLDSWQRAPRAAPPSTWDRGESAPPRIVTPVVPAVPPAPIATPAGTAGALLQSAGLSRNPAGDDAQLLASAGAILRASVAGLIAMSRMRSKARAELGAQSETAAVGPLEAEGAIEDVLAQLLAMSPAAAGDAIASACRDLDAHERATLAAMQAAFAAALDQFAPAAIKQRASSDATAWQAYERAFDSADGFVEVFAAALGEAYRNS